MGRNKQLAYWDVIAANCLLNVIDTDIAFKITKMCKDEEFTHEQYAKLRRAIMKLLPSLEVEVNIQFKSEEDADKYESELLIADKAEQETWGKYLRRKDIQRQIEEKQKIK